MNCKPGDLAIIVKSERGEAVGKIVACLLYRRDLRLVSPSGSVICGAWKTDRTFATSSGRPHSYVPDEWLKPIRDQPGEDEILRIVGLPINTKEPA